MSIRAKLIILKSIIAFICICGVFVASRYLLVEKIQSLQMTMIEDESTELIDMLRHEKENLHEINLDWAHWTSLYEFVQNLNEEFVEDNLTYSAFEGIRCNLLFLYDINGDLVWGKVFDLNTDEELDRIPFDQHIRESGLVYQPTKLSEQPILSDFMTFGDDPYLVSVRRVVDTNDELPSRGTIVMARIIDEALLESIGEFIGAGFAFSEGGPVDAIQSGVTKLSEEGVYLKVIDIGRESSDGIDQWVSNMVIQSGVDDTSMIVIASGEAEIIEETRSWMLFVFIALVVTIFIILLASYFGVNRIFVRKLESFDRAITYLKESKDHSGKPVAEGDDEIGRLITNFNELIDLQDEVSARLQMNEKQLHLIAEEAMVATEAKSSFLANMSHEIRTPMNAIIGFSDVLKTEELPDEAMKYVDMIHSSGQHLLDLINDVLDYSKIEAGKITLDADWHELQGIIAYMESVARPMIDRKGLAFLVEVDSGCPSRIHTDRKRFIQCLLNLVSNAVKYTHQGSVSLRFYCDPEDRSVLICDVSDTGIGVPREKQDLIFNAFEQSSNPENKEIEGTGLGLAITKSLAQKLGGDITLDSEPGVGSTFSFRVQVGIDTDSSQVVPSSRKPEAAKSLADVLRPGLRILAADDSATNRSLIKAIFRKTDVDLDLVEDGEQVISACREKQYDVILMDIFMPNMTGNEAARLLKSMNYNCPIIALTAAASEQDRQKCLASGCDDYLTKPFVVSQIVAVLEKYCGVS